MPIAGGVDCVDRIWPGHPARYEAEKMASFDGPVGSMERDENESTDQEDDKDLKEYSDEPVHAAGVPQCDLRLWARNYRTPEFRDNVFDMLTNKLGLSGWSKLPDIARPFISIHKVSGSLTNAVFYVTCPAGPSAQSAHSSLFNHSPVSFEEPPTVLLRIYGPSSGSLISRKHELHLLHTLSAQYGIGPLLLGTFFNGRIEQFFKSRPLSKDEIRIPRISRWIARKMRQLHQVDVSATTISADDNFRADSLRSAGSKRSHSIGAKRSSISSIYNSQHTIASWSSGCRSESDASGAAVCTEQPPSSSLSLRDAASPLSIINCPEVLVDIKHSRESLETNLAKQEANKFRNIFIFKPRASMTRLAVQRH